MNAKEKLRDLITAFISDHNDWYPSDLAKKIIEAFPQIEKNPVKVYFGEHSCLFFDDLMHPMRFVSDEHRNRFIEAYDVEVVK